MSVAGPEVNCSAESDHRHGKCSKCFSNAEKNLPQPPINEKHKQRNQEILERKRRTSSEGRKMSKQASGLESFQMAAKLALERQQQKKVEVFDSHAIDITQYKNADDSEILLPRHLKKKHSKQSLNLNKAKVENSIRHSLHTSQNDADDEADDGENGDDDGLEMLRSVEELRRASLAYGIRFGPQRTASQHDTLQAYFKFRKDNMAKEKRLKKVQAKAKIRNTEEKDVNSPSIVQKLVGSNSRTVLPPLKKLSFQNNSKQQTTGSSQINGVRHHKDKTNKERHAKLPKIAHRKSKAGKDGLTGRADFRNFRSCLVPLPDESGKSPPFTRKRNYTM